MKTFPKEEEEEKSIQSLFSLAGDADDAETDDDGESDADDAEADDADADDKD